MEYSDSNSVFSSDLSTKHVVWARVSRGDSKGKGVILQEFASFPASYSQVADNGYDTANATHSNSIVIGKQPWVSSTAASAPLNQYQQHNSISITPKEG